MTKRMLIDAAHAEETRVVVLDGQRIEELDFESQSRKQLRGNIYLAKVTRVEPSLQAAFVEYGGNRHGFLSFTEIHPDYYQIPVADREALLREESEDDDEPPPLHHEGEGEEALADDDDDDDVMEEELERRRRRLMRRYKIQEVVRRRQIMLVQVVKEERGNKGAALTTYLSLAGRYCVLMPNTARGGGISRKITNVTDRKRLKTVAQDLEVPHGMGVIVRTAGAARTKMEIKRDYEYLLRMWENIRETTLQSIAPALIYAEEDLVKRAIRDMYDKDLDGILVEGEAGYREARDFMRMIMPSQAKKIQHYREATPLFVKHRIEDQLAQINSPVVPLRSGGYIVINQTEALVAVDVNSGRATRERNIEATALKTNLEAAEETARQLRLRDLAGLIVIDFIDMDEGKNNRAVEKVLKDCLKDDRARVQMGKISSFGLMEISRQRRRSGVLEGTTHICEHCQGTGRVRSVESSALSALRAIEVEAAAGGAGAITVRLPSAVGLYVLNEKRVYIARLEQARDLTVTIALDETLSHADVEVERTESREPRTIATPLLAPLPSYEPDDDAFDYVEEEEEADEAEIEALADDADADAALALEGGETEAGDDEGRRRRRKRRRGGRRDDRDDRDEALVARSSSIVGDDLEEGGAEEGEAGAFEGESGESDADRRGRRRRRGRRGGRRLREEIQADDPYVWVHAHGGHDRPRESEDPYAWRDPHDRVAAPRAEPAPAPERRPFREPRRETPLSREPQAEAGADPYVWTEDKAGEAGEARTDGSQEGRSSGDRPPRARRPRNRRGRGGSERRDASEPTSDVLDEAPRPKEVRAGSDDADRVADETFAVDETAGMDAAITADEALEPVIPAMQAAPFAPADIEPISSEPLDDIADAGPIAAEPALIAPAPPAAIAEPPPREPDPAEIVAPPAAPRRGWWRRGG